MNPREAERDAIRARLAQSRAEIEALLEPPPPGVGESEAARLDGEFPRSHTLKLLMSGRGLSAVGALASGLLLARPGLVWRLMRAIPTGAIARMILLRVLTSFRERHSRA